MTHTPGPWKVEKTVTNGVQGFEIHWSTDGECVTDHVYEEDDARLIAAAPELLAALIRVKDCLGYMFGEDRQIVDAAIAKARGEQ